MNIPRETALAEIYEECGLTMTWVEGFTVPLDFGGRQTETKVLQDSAGIVDISYLYKLDVRGNNAMNAGSNQGVDQNVITRCQISEQHALFGSRSPFWLSDSNLSVIDVTDQWACFALAGPGSADVLQRLASIDLAKDVFPIGGAAATVAAGVYSLIGRLSKAFYLFIPRDGALTFWEAAQHAGAIPCGERAWIEFQQ
jgi:glycine cleavage system aminomethyltransferase T